MRLSSLARATLVAGLALAPMAASAQITVHTTLASYLAAISAPGTDTFNDLSSASTPSPLNRTAGAYSYRARAIGGSNNFFPAGTAADRWLSTDNAEASIVFDNFTASVRGVGGFFFGSDFDGAFAPGVTINLTLLSGSLTATQSVVATSTTNFIGFTSVGAITSLTVTATQPGGAFRWPTVNDLTLGAAPTNVIPEPSTYALMATGLIGLGAAARRRRARA